MVSAEVIIGMDSRFIVAGIRQVPGVETPMMEESVPEVGSPPREDWMVGREMLRE
jgi:hypothetical protein